MTEFGANMMPLDKYNHFFKIADQHKLSWTYWTLSLTPFIKFSHQAPFILLKDATKQGLIIDMHKPLDGNNVNQSVLDLLVRPYPQIVAGELLNTSLDSNDNKHFNMHYNATPNQTTTIFVPTKFCPQGCHVEVQDETKHALPTHQVTTKSHGQFVDITLNHTKTVELHVLIKPKTWWQRWLGS